MMRICILVKTLALQLLWLGVTVVLIIVVLILILVLNCLVVLLAFVPVNYLLFTGCDRATSLLILGLLGNRIIVRI